VVTRTKAIRRDSKNEEQEVDGMGLIRRWTSRHEEDTLRCIPKERCSLNISARFGRLRNTKLP
jgi:hypothetical protein